MAQAAGLSGGVPQSPPFTTNDAAALLLALVTGHRGADVPEVLSGAPDGERNGLWFKEVGAGIIEWRYYDDGDDTPLATLNTADGTVVWAPSASHFVPGTALTPAALTGDVVDFDPTDAGHPSGISTAGWLRLDATGDVALHGLVGGAHGQILPVHNVSSHVLTLKSNSGDVTTAVKFELTADLVLGPGTIALLQKDSISDVWRAVAGGGGGGSGAVLRNFVFAASAGQTTFSGNDTTGAMLVYHGSAINVTLNGVTLTPGVDYTATSGYSVILAGAAAAGDVLVVSAWSVSDVTSAGQFSSFQFTAGSGQTTITGADNNGGVLAYTPNAVEVFLNGRKLVPGVDYTATTGSSVVLAAAASAGDAVEVLAWHIVGLAAAVQFTPQPLSTPQKDQARANLGLMASTSPTAFRNRVINGNFAINQRVKTGTVTLAAGEYGHDRWRAGAGGCTYTFATDGVDTIITITAGTLQQVIESIFVEGGVYVVSWSGTSQARVWQGAASGAYAAAPLVTAALAAATNTVVEFGPGTLTRVQIEPGAVATAFERRDNDLIRCWRYYYRWAPGVSGAQLSPLRMRAQATTPLAGGALLPLPIDLRAVPTVTCSAASDFTLVGASGAAATAVNFGGSNARSISADFSTASGIGADANFAICYTGTAAAWIAASAEL